MMMLPVNLGQMRTCRGAVGPPQDPVVAFTVPVLYSAARLSYMGMQPSALWSDLVVVPVPDAATGTNTLWLTATMPTGTDSM